MQSKFAMNTQFCIYFVFCIGVVLTHPASWNFTSEYFPIYIENVQYARIGEKRCMKQLDCFEITKDFYDPLKRPVNLLPHDRTSIDTKFDLYTKFHPMEKHRLSANDPEDIKESGINPTHKTVFIVHGFFDSQLYGKWMQSLKTSLLLHGDYNVIIVDWSKGNGAPYTQATANTRVVGAEIALLIKTLQKHVGISPMDCHIIGHSLGSHIAGYAGERLKKLGRITALDPAQPYFQGMPPSVRIDPTDADFVDVIHTDSSSSKFLALGMSQAVGHVDFYPNNGMSQPGCSAFSAIHSIFLEGLVDAARQFVSCNHQRSVTLFTYSLNFKKALPISHQCKSWNDYKEGLCSGCGKQGERCAIMGMRADQFKKFKNDSNSVKMYLTTDGDPPYWVFSYQIAIKLKKPTTSFKDRSGTMYVTVQGSKSRHEFELKTKSGELIHGATYSFFESQREDLGKIQSVTFKWITKSWTIFTHNIYLEFVKITPMSIIEKEIRDQNTKKFCYKSNKPVDSKQEVLLYECS